MKTFLSSLCGVVVGGDLTDGLLRTTLGGITGGPLASEKATLPLPSVIPTTTLAGHLVTGRVGRTVEEDLLHAGGGGGGGGGGAGGATLEVLPRMGEEAITWLLGMTGGKAPAIAPSDGRNLRYR